MSKKNYYAMAQDLLNDALQEEDYYCTVTYPDGSQCGPTRLLGIHDEKSAKREQKRIQKQHPDCKVEVS